MKIQLDTENKTIRLENSVELSKLIETLDKLLPNKEWKKFTLETNTVINHWNSPIVIERYREWQPIRPWQPWYLTVGKTTAEYKAGDQMALKSGVFNLELKA